MEDERARPAHLTLSPLKRTIKGGSPHQDKTLLFKHPHSLPAFALPLSSLATFNLLLTPDCICLFISLLYLCLFLSLFEVNYLQIHSFPTSSEQLCHKRVTFGLALCESVFRIPEDVLDGKTKSMLQKGKPSKYRRSPHSLVQSLEPSEAKGAFNSKTLWGLFLKKMLLKWSATFSKKIRI